MINHTQIKFTQWLKFIFIISLLVVIIIECLLNLCPPITRDALIHHLAIPKIWLSQQSLKPISWSDFSFYPMNLQLLYACCLWLGSDILPKYIHMAFGLGCGILIYLFILKRLGQIWALLGMMMFVSLPIIVWLSTAAYVDLGMTFFTTACMICLIRFHWEGLQIKYLCFAAIMMGLALGVKYNALIAFVFFNIAIFYMTYKQNDSLLKSVNYTFIFFMLSSAIAAPWLIRNIIYAGNPFYPLFNNVFKYVFTIPAHPLFCENLEPVFSMNGIVLRKLLFNESLFETLFIPIRMFFQGNDYTYEHFQGRLNPMLILFLPFAFLPASRKPWMLFMASFIFFFGYVAFFTTKHQIRYILPIFPFICLLSVFGLHALFKIIPERIVVARYGLFLLIFCLFGLNIQYIHSHFNRMNPISYLTGQQSRTAYLKTHLQHYEAFEYINTHLPKDSRVLTLFLGRRGYFLDCVYKHEPLFGMNILNCMVQKSQSKEAFDQYINQLDITHMLVRIDMLDSFLTDRLSNSERGVLRMRIQERFRRVQVFDNYVLWALMAADASL